MSIDSRIRRAVAAALASAGCATTPAAREAPLEPPAAPSAAPSVTPAIAMRDAAIEAEVPDASMPDASSAPSSAVSAAPSQSQSEALRACHDYARTDVDLSRAQATRAGAASHEAVIVTVPRQPVTVRSLGEDGVSCVIVRKRTPAVVWETIEPVCCPQAHSKKPCPPARVERVNGEHVILEVVRIDQDGRLRARKLFSFDYNPNPRLQPACGRRPEGFTFDARTPPRTAGARLARMAELEAASIDAFDRLERELTHHGAPRSMIRAARRARADEARHARVITRCAKRRGGSPRLPRALGLPCRELAAVALENAVEGCVLETFGALVATFQATRARAPALRRVFARIAADERRHAALAVHTHEWLMRRLSHRERARIERARRRAVRALVRALRQQRESAPTEEERSLGMPSGAEAFALARAFFTQNVGALR